MSALETVGLTCVYPSGNVALDGVDFVAEQGEFVALVGPNGSGKTTLFRHFGGLLRATRGRVLVEGRDVARSDRAWLYSRIGFVFQDPNDQLFAATVGEDVAFGPRNLGLPPAEVADRIHHALDWVGMGGHERHPIHALSFGQKRRVALAGVLAMRPDILVLDEPTSGLDPLGASRLLALLRRLNQQMGTTVVMATHDIDVVPLYAERVYVLRAGRVAAVGTPAAVFAQAELLRECDLRPPRAAHALRLVGDEWGQSLAELPMTIEEAAHLAVPTNVPVVRPRGFPTGVAAAAAARAAAELLLLGRRPSAAVLRSTSGAVISIAVAHSCLSGKGAEAAVVKKAMSEDDPLGGVEVCARVELSESVGIVIEGGVGVGRVARPGLSLPVGEAAINPIPRQMIADAVGAVLPPGQGARVVISVPRGEELAARTINPAQGIVGGIAILGTAARSRPDGYPDTVIVSEAKNLGGDSSLAALARNNIRPPHSPEPSPAALCFMGHGSRAADANAAMYQVIELARRRTGYPIVEAGFMDLCPPSIEEAVDACVAQGARRILLFPYFLHLGHHVRRDLPDLMLRLRMKYPAVEITMAPHLGFHPKLADVVVDRIAEAEAQLMAPVRATGTGDG